MAITAVATSPVKITGVTTARTITVEVPAVTETGDLLVVLCNMNDVSASSASLTGWTQQVANVAAGTMRINAWTKTRAAGETSYTMNITGSDASVHTVVCIKGWDSTKALVVGSVGLRATNGTSTTTVAPAITVATAPSLVLHFSAERTNTTEPEPTVDNGFSRLVWLEGSSGTGAVSMFASTKIVSAAGDTGTVTTTYPNTSAANGAAVLLSVVQGDSAPPAVGQIKYISQPYFDHTEISVGAAFYPAVTSATCQLVENDVVVASETFSINSTSKWGTTSFLGLTPGKTYTARVVIDGVIQTDKQATVRTLPGIHAQSFTFVTGSCQFTGSNHPIWDRIAEANPVFIAHQGDLHYGDTQDITEWRSFTESSFSATRFSNLVSKVPMHWQWDNHDRIIVDTLNLGQTNPAMLTEWRSYAGGRFPLLDTNARTWIVGRVRFIVTDHWTVRDDPDLTAEPRTMMGSEQKEWFKDVLLGAQEPVIVWFDQWTGQNHANGRWNSFNAETTELENWIDAHPSIKARMILTGGDSHQINADSGTRTYEHRFDGIPNLNASGFNRSSTAIDPTGGWDIIDAALRTSAQPEADWGAYSRFTVQDDGATIHIKWEGVRVNAEGVEDVMATWERKQGTVTIGGETCTLWGYNGTRAVPLGLELVPAADPLPEGLAARWTFDAGIADVVSGRELTLTSAGLAPARGGYALAAMSSAAKAESPDGFLDLTGFTIAFWLYTPTTAETARVAFLAGSTTVAELYGGWRLLAGTVYEVNRALVVTDTGSFNRIQQTTTGGGAVPAQSWRHVAATYDGAALTLYTNGVQRSTGPKTGTVSDPDTFTIDLVTGSLVDDVEIWSRALTQAEITDMYNRGL